MNELDTSNAAIVHSAEQCTPLADEMLYSWLEVCKQTAQVIQRECFATIFVRICLQ